MPVPRAIAALGRLFRRTPPPPVDILEAYAHEVVPVLDRAEWLYQYWLEQSSLFSDSEKLGNVAAIHRWETASMGRSLEKVVPPEVLARAHESVLDALDMASRAAQLLSSGSRFHNAGAVCEGQSLLSASRDRRLAALESMRRYLAAVMDTAGEGPADPQAALDADTATRTAELTAAAAYVATDADAVQRGETRTAPGAAESPHPSATLAAGTASVGVAGAMVLAGGAASLADGASAASAAGGVAASAAAGPTSAASLFAASLAPTDTDGAHPVDTATSPYGSGYDAEGAYDHEDGYHDGVYDGAEAEYHADGDDGADAAYHDDHYAEGEYHTDDEEDALPWLTRLAEQQQEGSAAATHPPGEPSATAPNVPVQPPSAAPQAPATPQAPAASQPPTPQTSAAPAPPATEPTPAPSGWGTLFRRSAPPPSDESGT